ncbi:hypothetical protein ORI98_05275, partial [Shewanella sp. ULN5]|uniref:FimV/HubP family polar landmark protein n=1 Tax=Shewanella sp. ULN5 TaxID=2994678 RepID=UPI00273D6F62
MTSRTSYWVGLLLSATTAISASQLLLSAQADTLKITGPNGEVKQARQYGPTTPSDTFWSIAQKVRPNDRITIYQVMSALFDANPHAFSDNNYNSLEKGMILAIPSAEVMAAIPKAQAKLRAERDDRLARTAKPAVTPKPSVNTNVVKQVQAKPVTPEKPLQITPQQPVVANVEPLSAAKKNEMAELNNELDKANNKTLMLTDELARAQDQLMATRSDNQVLKQKVEELTQIISNLEEDVQFQLEKHQLLVNKNEMLATELEEANKPAIEQPTDFWRNLTNNTGLLIAAAALPILLLFGVIFLILRRRANAKDDPKSAPETVSEPKAAASDANNDNDLEDLAVHLDSDDEESIDDLLDLDSLDMQPETELHIDDEQMDMAAAMFIEEPDTAQEPVAEEDDDVTSLDDLWAEAMEEQDSELDPLETDEDLDNLLAGLDDDDLDEPAVSAAPEDDLDALLANIDNEQPADIIDEVKSSSVSSEQDNIDDLLAGFEMSADDVDEPETLSDNPDSNNVNEDDIDSLLAGFDVDDSEAVSKSSENDESIANIPADTEADDDIDALLASFETQKTSEEPEDDDIDALLASFDAQDDNETQDAPSTAEHNSDDANEDLADAIAAELELDDDLANKDVDVAEDDDIDALLASFNAQDANETQDAPSTEDSSEDDNEDLADAIAAELESDDDLANKDVNVAENDDIDALLASFDAQDDNETQDAPSTADDNSDDDNEDLADAIAAELESDDDLTHKDINVAEDDDIDALLASFDAQDANETQDTPSIADTSEDYNEDLADAIAAELESDDDLANKDVDVAEDDDIDALLASFDAQDANETQDTPSIADTSEDYNEDLADAIAAELESDDDLANKDVDVAEDDDIDALLASFDAQDANETQD